MRGEQPKNMETQIRSVLTRDVEAVISSTYRFRFHRFRFHQQKTKKRPLTLAD